MADARWHNTYESKADSFLSTEARCSRRAIVKIAKSTAISWTFTDINPGGWTFADLAPLNLLAAF